MTDDAERDRLRELGKILSRDFHAIRNDTEHNPTWNDTYECFGRYLDQRLREARREGWTEAALWYYTMRHGDKALDSPQDVADRLRYERDRRYPLNQEEEKP